MDGQLERARGDDSGVWHGCTPLQSSRREPLCRHGAGRLHGQLPDRLRLGLNKQQVRKSRGTFYL